MIDPRRDCSIAISSVACFLHLYGYCGTFANISCALKVEWVSWKFECKSWACLVFKYSWTDPCGIPPVELESIHFAACPWNGSRPSLGSTITRISKEVDSYSESKSVAKSRERKSNLRSEMKSCQKWIFSMRRPALGRLALSSLAEALLVAYFAVHSIFPFGTACYSPFITHSLYFPNLISYVSAQGSFQRTYLTPLGTSHHVLFWFGKFGLYLAWI